MARNFALNLLKTNKILGSELTKLLAHFLHLGKGYIYTAEHGFEKAVSAEITKFSPTVSLDGVASSSQVGVGVSKDIGHGWSVGAGVATEWDQWDPDWYASIMKEFKF